MSLDDYWCVGVKVDRLRPDSISGETILKEAFPNLGLQMKLGFVDALIASSFSKTKIFQ